MNGFNGERLYELLPAIYRTRDAAQGDPLRTLLAVIEDELQNVESDIDGLYRDWFIETCAEWVIPYIGDLLGVRSLHTIEDTDLYSLRAYVANTLFYRRRKGTVAVLEQLARDVTGWPARAVEFFQLLSTTQHVNHVRGQSLHTPDLRDANQLELLGTPFEQASYTAEVRRIPSRRGKYNIPNIGLFLWRLQPYLVEGSTARAVNDPDDGRYTLNPLGVDAPLFNRPKTEESLTELAREINVPAQLRRRPLHDESEALRRALVDEQPRPETGYFDDNPAFRIVVDGAEVPFEAILICDLHDTLGTGGWRRPPEILTYTRLNTDTDPPTLEDVQRSIQVAVDPDRGRLAFPAGAIPDRVEVHYAYSFSSDVGGGPYSRQNNASANAAPVTWQVDVGQNLTPVAGQVFNTLAEAVVEWNAQPAGTGGQITIRDSRSYRENLVGDRVIDVPEGSRLAVVADALQRPHVQGDISVRGTDDANSGSDSAGELLLEGLLVEGTLQVLAGNLGSLRLSHCTLVPGLGGLEVNPSTVEGKQNDRLHIDIRRSIVGSIDLPDTMPELFVQDSIVDGQKDEAISAPGVAADIQTSTLFGATTVRSLNASESIFMGTIVAERRQIGCVRFSYVPQGSRTPRCHRCQPDLALADIVDPAQQSSVRKRLTPQFTSSAFGDPAYAQLGLACVEEIRTGAEDGSEMGVFSHLKQPQREANLRTALDEYLRFGLEAGIFYVT